MIDKEQVVFIDSPSDVGTIRQCCIKVIDGCLSCDLGKQVHNFSLTSSFMKVSYTTPGSKLIDGCVNTTICLPMHDNMFLSTVDKILFDQS